ncbi:MAG: MFS transporter [Candidatus Rokubacteria bacterium]|nr:MFS transporter [Candidatus Rokubacteria bacterium]
MMPSVDRSRRFMPWLMWGIPSLIFLVAFFHRVAPGVIAKELMESFHATGALLGLLSAVYFYLYAGLLIPAGVLVDAWGARRVVAVGGTLMGLGTVLMGSAGSTGPLFVGRVLVGSGASVTFVGALKVAATWFPRAGSEPSRRSRPPWVPWERSSLRRRSRFWHRRWAGAAPSSWSAG